MKETRVTTETIYSCDKCKRETDNPAHERWFGLDNKDGFLCQSCGVRFFGEFSDWLKALAIQVNIEFLNTDLCVNDMIGKISIKRISMPTDGIGGLKQKRIA